MATTTTLVTDTNLPAPLAYLPATRNEVLKVIATGVIAGLLIPLLSLLLANYFIQPVFCNGGDNFSVCASGGIIANHVAAVLVGFGVFAVLNQWAVYRALLIVVAVTVVTWGIKKYADPLTSGNWLEYYLFSALLYALAYALFYWLLRLRHFIAGLAATIIAVVAACWAVVA